MKIVIATLNAKYIHMSLALRYLKAYGEKDFDIDIAEYTIKDPAMNIVSDLYQRGADVIGFSCYIWNIEETIKIVKMLKKIMPDTLIVLGGPEVSYDTEEWMERVPEVDFIVMGEGEETFHQLLTEIQTTHKYHFVYGVAYRKGEEIVLMPARPKMNLNDIPSPHRFEEDRSELAKRIVYFETSRGCPFSCQFCLSSIEVGVRYFDIERVKQDLLYLIESGAKQIKFVDRTFNIKRDYAMEMFRFLIDNHQGCVFQFEITADIMRPEVLEFLAEHAPPGIFRFEIGVQSTNDVTNELIQRRQNFNKLARTVSIIRDSGKILQHLDLIAGLPEEDYESFGKTFNDVFALRPEELQLGFLKMLRGTGLRRDAEKYGYQFMDNAPYEILSNNVLSFADIVRIKRVEDVLEKYWNAHRLDRTVQYLIEQEFPSPFDFFQSFGDYWEEQGWQKIGHQLEDLFTRLHAFLLARGTARMPLIEGLMKLDYFLNHKYKPRKIWWTLAFDKQRQAELIRMAVERADEVKACRWTGPIRGSVGGAVTGLANSAALDHVAKRATNTMVAGDAEARVTEPKSQRFATSDEESLAHLGLTERELHKHAVVEVLPFDLHRYCVEGVMDEQATSLLLVYYSPDGQAFGTSYAMRLDSADQG